MAVALHSRGNRYLLGAKDCIPCTKYARCDPNDCSGLVRYAACFLGVDVPDGSWIQVRHCRNHGLLIPISQAVKTPGALLFSFSGNPFTGGRPTHAHVAIAQGDGTTIECRGRAYGCGVWSATKGRAWTHAGLVPGLRYGSNLSPPVQPKPEPKPEPKPPKPEPKPPDTEDEDMPRIYVAKSNSYTILVWSSGSRVTLNDPTLLNTYKVLYGIDAIPLGDKEFLDIIRTTVDVTGLVGTTP